jgi:hypothetical protein
MSSYDKSTLKVGVRMGDCQGYIKYPHSRQHEKKIQSMAKTKREKLI